MSYHQIPNDETHAWIAPRPGDARGPCPALNTMANHGYLPRDGKNLGFFQLIQKCGEVFNFSAPLAALLSTEAMLLCGNGYSVTLEQLRRHNGIEHDASLSRADAVSGNAWTPDPKVIAAFLAECSSEEGLTFDDLCRYRAKLELALPEGKLDWFHNIVARGEACLTIGVLGTGGGEDGTARVVSKEVIRTIFLEEKLPDWWTKPAHQQTLKETLDAGKKFDAGVAKWKAQLGKNKSV